MNIIRTFYLRAKYLATIVVVSLAIMVTVGLVKVNLEEEPRHAHVKSIYLGLLDNVTYLDEEKSCLINTTHGVIYTKCEDPFVFVRGSYVTLTQTLDGIVVKVESSTFEGEPYRLQFISTKTLIKE